MLEYIRAYIHRDHTYRSYVQIIHTYIDTCMHACMCVCACMHACMHNMNTYIHAYTHTHIHTCIHTEVLLAHMNTNILWSIHAQTQNKRPERRTHTRDSIQDQAWLPDTFHTVRYNITRYMQIIHGKSMYRYTDTYIRACRHAY